MSEPTKPTEFRVGPVKVQARATRHLDRMADEYGYMAWLDWTCDGLFLGQSPAVAEKNWFISVAEAHAAASAALAQIKAEMLRDLLSGPEWEGLAEALEGGAQACGYYNCTAKASLLRKLAETLEVGK